MKWTIAAVVIGALAAGCGGEAAKRALRESEVRRRASFDLDCAEHQLTVVELDERTRGITGCGSRATYVRQNGAWFLNSTSGGEIRVISAAPAEPPPDPQRTDDERRRTGLGR